MTECEPMCDHDNSTDAVLTRAAAALAALESALRAPHDSRDAVVAALGGARAPCCAADDALARLLAACAAADTSRAVRDALQTWRRHERAQPVPPGCADSAALEHDVAERMALVQRVQTLRETLAREGSQDSAAAPAEPHDSASHGVDSLVALLHTQAHRIQEALDALAPEQTQAE